MNIKTIRAFTMALIIGASFGLQSCGQPAEHNHDHEHQSETAEAKYQCPMDCEDGKTYSENVGCPACGMDLKEVK